MSGIAIHEICKQPPIGCWAPAHRAFLTRHQQILQIAIGVFGRRELAERWMISPALGLGHHAPCTLLGHHATYALLCDFLERLEHGVYT